jgi:hypothetical protein
VSWWARHRWWLVALVAAAVLTLALALGADDAWARVGGGETFSTGRSSGGGRGGDGGGGEADLIFLLIWLAIEHPTIGVPLLLIAVAVIVVRAWMKGGRRARDYPSEPEVWRDPQHGHRGDTTGIADLRAADPGFSMPVLLDYLQLLHRRATEAATNGNFEPLLPFVSEGARAQLRQHHHGVVAIDQVVVGGLTVERVERRGERFILQAGFRGTRRERLQDGSERRVFVEETWRLARLGSARSGEPDEVVRMGCPSCGAAIDTDRAGQCRSCGTPIVEGLLQWRAESVELHTRRRVEPPKVGFAEGGAEPSVHAPTRIDPGLGRAWREFRARHQGFDPAAFQRRTRDIFLALQTAWSEGRWGDARPYVTDTLYQTLRFHVEQYAEHGLRNRQADIEMIKQEIVKVELDAWYESITVRVYGSSKDWVEDASGKVVGGNARADRQFSEYWTFLRAIGTGDTLHDAKSCPSCGAPLDKVSQAGVCGYCDSKITTGKFDWVLTRIDQPQVYGG